MADYERVQDSRREVRPKSEAATEPDALDRVARVAAAVGNRSFGAFAHGVPGILPNGRAHPDVEATIARTRGGGQPLASSTRQRFGERLGDSLDDVRVHDDATADALSRSVSARAFTVGSDVYFASGEYRPGSSDGDRLVAHELTHVVQQRGAPSTGPLNVSNPADPLESEAETATDGLVG